MAFAQDTKLNSRLNSGACGPIPPPRGRSNAICFIPLMDNLTEYSKVSKETNDALRTKIQSTLDDVNALIDSHECSSQLNDHGKTGGQCLLTITETMRENNFDHFLQALEVENLHIAHQHLVELTEEDMGGQNLEKPPPEPPPQNHTKLVKEKSRQEICRMNTCNLGVIGYSTQAKSMTLKQQQPSIIFDKGEELQEDFGEENKMCKSKGAHVCATGFLKMEYPGIMQIKAKHLMESGTKSVITGFLELGKKIVEILQITISWKKSEVLKLVLAPLSGGCKGEDHNKVKIFYVYLKDERSLDDLCKRIMELDHTCDLD